MSLTQRLRHRITIQEKVEEVTTYGEGVGYHWQDFVPSGYPSDEKIPAEVLTGPGREFRAADAKQSETSARITLRWFPGLLADMRILWDGHVYDIQSLETDRTGRKEWRLRCVDGVSDGG